jgi:hypothetical protein
MDPQKLVPQLAGKKRSAQNEARFQRDRELAAERNKVPISEDFEDNLQKGASYKRPKL